MRLSAHQPIMYGGYLGHFAKLAWCDEWVVMDVCIKEDSGWENRNRIRVGAVAQWLTVPVMHSRETPLSELRIAPGNWQRKHWRTIELAYRKAPFFDLYAGDLLRILSEPWCLLRDLDEALFRFCAKCIGIDRPIRRASTMGLTGKKSALVLDMCRKAGASEYLFGALGRGYADVEAFRAAGIEPLFQTFEHPTYRQLGPGFVPYLSVLDALMNVGGEATWRLLVESSAC